MTTIHRRNSTESKDSGKYTKVFAVEFLLSWEKSLDEAVRNVLSCIHTCLDVKDHVSAGIDEVLRRRAFVFEGNNWSGVKKSMGFSWQGPLKEGK